jgi:hypothetical protein
MAPNVLNGFLLTLIFLILQFLILVLIGHSVNQIWLSFSKTFTVVIVVVVVVVVVVMMATRTTITTMVVVVMITTTTTLMHGIYNYIPEINLVSGAYSAAAVLFIVGATCNVISHMKFFFVLLH